MSWRRIIAIFSISRNKEERMKYDVVGLGNALLDFQVRVPFEALSELQVVKNSMTLVAEADQHKALSYIKEKYHSGCQISSGGCAANTLAGLANYGGSGFFFGRVGSDDNGRHYREDLENCGLTTQLSQSSQGHTGTCLALITPDAERTMLTHLGVAIDLSEKDIEPAPIADGSIVYIEGYLWDSPSARKASIKAMDIAKAQGKKVALTFADSFCVERHFQDFLDLAKNRVDILFCNESEALMATKKSSVKDAFAVMKDWTDYVCMTLGPRGAYLSNRSTNTQEELSTWDVKLVDKLGAGDLFAAGVLFGIGKGKSLRECGYLGCYAATRVIQQMGARLLVELSPEIELAARGPADAESTLTTAS